MPEVHSNTVVCAQSVQVSYSDERRASQASESLTLSGSAQASGSAKRQFDSYRQRTHSPLALYGFSRPRGPRTASQLIRFGLGHHKDKLARCGRDLPGGLRLARGIRSTPRDQKGATAPLISNRTDTNYIKLT